MSKTIPLTQLPLGQPAKVVTLDLDGLPRRRLLDLGLVPTTAVTALRRSPTGDPTAFKVRGATIALRNEVANNIWVLID